MRIPGLRLYVVLYKHFLQFHPTVGGGEISSHKYTPNFFSQINTGGSSKTSAFSKNTTRSRSRENLICIMSPTLQLFLLHAHEICRSFLLLKDTGNFRPFASNGYCRLCFRLRSVLLYVGFHCLSLHVSAYMAIFKCVRFFIYIYFRMFKDSASLFVWFVAFFYVVTLVIFSICVLFCSLFIKNKQTNA
jgi:hypothetical protein